jgi:hypothetical protein
MSFKTFLKSKESTDISNFCTFVGNKYFIPNEELPNFRKLYCDSVNNGEFLYMVERVRYPCKFYIDVDKKDCKGLDLFDIMVKILKYYDKYETLVCVCTEKNGIHIIFQNLIVDNVDQAISQVPNELNDFIDTSVYSTGLRMIGSRKPNEDRVYLPRFKMKGEMVLKHYLKYKITIRLLERSIINLDHTDINPVSKHITNLQCQVCSEPFNWLSDLYPSHKGMFIKKVYKFKNNIYIQTNSKRCLNMKNEFHKSNFVYFMIFKNKKGVDFVTQKCYCTCDTTEGRLNGKCKSFYSSPIPLTYRQKCMLKLATKNV